MHFKALSSAVASLTRREAGEREKDIRLLLFLFGYPPELLRREEHLRASLCKILISSFAHKMDFAHTFSVDFF